MASVTLPVVRTTCGRHRLAADIRPRPWPLTKCGQPLWKPSVLCPSPGSPSGVAWPSTYAPAGLPQRHIRRDDFRRRAPLLGVGGQEDGGGEADEGERGEDE